MAPRWRRSSSPCPKINLKRRANSRFHLNANPKIETEWFLDARTVILGLEIPRNLVEQTNLSLFLFLFRSPTLNHVPSISFFLSFFQNAHVFEEIFIRGKISPDIEEELFNFESGQLSSYETLSARNDIEALFARSKLFIPASLPGLRDRPTELSRHANGFQRLLPQFYYALTKVDRR